MRRIYSYSLILGITLSSVCWSKEKTGIVITYTTQEKQNFFNLIELKEGDIIVAINGVAIDSTDDSLEKIIRNARDIDLVFTVKREDQIYKIYPTELLEKNSQKLIPK